MTLFVIWSTIYKILERNADLKGLNKVRCLICNQVFNEVNNITVLITHSKSNHTFK